MSTASHLSRWLAVVLLWWASALGVRGDDQAAFSDPQIGFSYSISLPFVVSVAERTKTGVVLLLQNPVGPPVPLMPSGTLCRIAFFHSDQPVSLDAFADHIRTKLNISPDKVKSDPFQVREHDTREIVAQGETDALSSAVVDFVFVGGRSGMVMFTCSTSPEEYPVLKKILPSLLEGLKFE